MSERAPAPATDPPAVERSGPQFGIVMNVYNGAAFVAAAIDSVLAQGVADWELLIWDDASTDGSEAICRGYADPRIRYHRSPVRVPLGTARNAAIAMVRGAWIAFLDQDDLWLPGKLARQAAAIADGGERLGLVYGRTIRFDAHGDAGEFDPWHRIGRQPEGDIFRALLRRPSFVALSSACLRAGALRGVGPIPASVALCPDYFLFVAVARDWQAACVRQPVCRYRLHDTNMSVIHAAAIHRETAAIVAAAARPGDGAIVRRRRAAAATLIAIDELRTGHPRAAARRFVREGSPTFLLGHLVLRHAWRPLLRSLGKR